jgi:uncharacterized membrane protein (DUF485 family)
VDDRHIVMMLAASYGAGKFRLHPKVVTPLSTETTPTPAEKYVEVQQSAEFAGLRKTIRGFAFPMTVAFFLWYLLYVLLSAYARGFMGAKIIGHINVALIFGLLQFVSTFLIAWYYSRFAAAKVDPTADKIRDELNAEGLK